MAAGRVGAAFEGRVLETSGKTGKTTLGPPKQKRLPPKKGSLLKSSFCSAYEPQAST